METHSQKKIASPAMPDVKADGLIGWVRTCHGFQTAVQWQRMGASSMHEHCKRVNIEGGAREGQGQEREAWNWGTVIMRGSAEGVCMMCRDGTRDIEHQQGGRNGGRGCIQNVVNEWVRCWSSQTPRQASVWDPKNSIWGALEKNSSFPSPVGGDLQISPWVCNTIIFGKVNF